MRPFFLVRDIAKMWTEERAAAAGLPVALTPPVVDATVRSYVKHSRPTRPGTRQHRYETNPMPAPVYLDPNGREVNPAGDLRGYTPYWYPADGEDLAGLERRLRAWWHSRLGPGAGGGRPRKAPPRRVRCGCGCGEQVIPGSMCDRSAADRAGVDR